MSKLFSLVMWMGGLCCLSGSVLALEAVVQSGVGAGSAVAGSIGAVNARADAIGANVTAVNALVNQQAQEIKELKEQVSQTLAIVQQLQGGGNGGASVDTVNQSVQSIINCNAQGKVWDGTQCKDLARPKGMLCGMRLAYCTFGTIGNRGKALMNEVVYDVAPAPGYDKPENIPCEGTYITAECARNVFDVATPKPKCPTGYTGVIDMEYSAWGLHDVAEASPPTIMRCAKN